MSSDDSTLNYEFQGATATLILNVDPAGYDLNPQTFSFTTNACYIYAETINIPNGQSWTLTTPGQTLGIFCNQMQFTGTSPVTFDVSGPKGTDGATTTTNLNGGNSGNFYLYIENITDATFKYLNIRACGGNGGRGVSYFTDTVGGNGGNAGNGGNVSVVFGSIFYDLANSVHGNLTSPWLQQAYNAVNSVLPTANVLTGATLQVSYTTAQVASWLSITSSYNTYAATLQGLSTSLATVGAAPTRTGGHPTSNTKTLAAGLKTTIDGILKGTQAPVTVPANTDYITTLESAISDFMKKGGVAREQTLVGCINSFPTITVSATTDLSNALQNIIEASLGLVTEIQNITSHNIVSTNKGYPGLGGNSGPGVTPSEGNQGSSGTDGNSTSQYLFYNGSPLDSNTSVPFAFPEQCRMLLNLADSNYFVTDPSSWANAISYYQRLVKRLSFLDSQTVSSSNLAGALEYFVFPLGLTWNPLNELGSIYATAQNRLSQAKLGQDMFGHSENWVPRLSSAFYKERVVTMLASLTKMENAIATFTQANQENAIKLEQCQVGISNAQAGLQSAQDRIQLISGPDGFLSTYEYQVETTQPLIQPALTNVKQKLDAIEQDLQLAKNLNPDDLLNAFSTLAMCPSALMGIAELGTVFYKTSTELTDSDDVEVNRNLVIQKVETCENTLDSLNETFTQNTDGTVDLNDPGANLIFAAEDSVNDLLQEFSNIIPVSDTTGVKDAFKAYTDLVLKRNQYITSYNTSLQLLLQAINDQAYYQQENQTWSQQLLKVNMDVPAVLFWLEKNRDDLRFQIMQKLNYEARANRFWGLGVKLTTMMAPGPLQGATDLQIDQGNIDNDFEKCLTSLSDNNMNQWPAPGKSGPFYTLPPDVLSNLKNLSTETQSPPGLIYSTSFVINAGDVPLLNSMANIRLTQARLWLLGATITSDPDPQGNQVLSVLLTQSGDETIYDPYGTPYEFVHDPVTVEFQYFCNKVLESQDCITENVWSLQGLAGDYNGTGVVPVGSVLTAPIGPYSRWTITIKSNANLNPNLDLSQVSAAYLEFWGRSQAALQLNATDRSVASAKDKPCKEVNQSAKN
ncbi:hypothetical protein TWF694_008024 [Orbilia ellipsospora]|uniref:Uncharacterized protein n=1 Tax=Orbilia ellipsospora TaxID=2528407 RepID=A0AAV9XFU1_9PEZI